MQNKTGAALPLISVVIPIYNMRGRLEKLVEALQAQTYPNLEILFCDDASTDGIQEYFNQLKESHAFERMRFLVSETNRGASNARNRGILAANGEYVAMIDADDLVEPNCFSELYEKMNDGIDYVFCGSKRFEAASGASKPLPLEWPQNSTRKDLLVRRIFDKNGPSHYGTLYRREFLVKNNILYTEGCTAGEDCEFLIRLLSHNGRPAWIEDCLYVYVIHAEMGSRANVLDRDKRISRYADHTEAQIREVGYILDSTVSEKIKNFARYMMLPAAWQRRLSVKAMHDDRAGFDEMRRSPQVRSILLSAWRSFFYKPEVFLRSCAVLLAPEIYFKKYLGYKKYMRF